MWWLPISVSGVVLRIAFGVFAATGALIAYAVARRGQRQRHFRVLDELRKRCNPIVSAIVEGQIEYAVGLAALRDCHDPRNPLMLEPILMGRSLKPGQVAIHRGLCEGLGLVAEWQRQLSGRPRTSGKWRSRLLERVRPLAFLRRAQNAHNLGVIRHRPSWPLLLEALDDPHLDVRSAAAQSLAEIGEPASFPILLERLERAVLRTPNSLSIRHLKSVLVSFPLTRSRELLPALTHEHPRMRFLAIDIVRTLVEDEASRRAGLVLRPPEFAQELRDLVLGPLAVDENPDVRARCAPILTFVEDPKAGEVLVRLMEDPVWFVRLHAVRAAAGPAHSALMGPLGARLTDSHWRVREAASAALLALGAPGLNRLLEHFLSTNDRYSREQVAETLERAGRIHDLLNQFGCEGCDSQTQALERLIELGKAGTLEAVGRNGLTSQQRRRLIHHLGLSAHPRVQEFVARLRAAAPDTTAPVPGNWGTAV